MGLLVRIDQRNPCTVSGVVNRRANRQGYPCEFPSFANGAPPKTYRNSFGQAEEKRIKLEQAPFGKHQFVSSSEIPS